MTNQQADAIAGALFSTLLAVGIVNAVILGLVALAIIIRRRG